MTNKRKKKKLTSAPDPIMKMGSAASSVAKNHWPSVLCILRGVTFKGQEAQYDLQMHKNTLSCEWWWSSICFYRSKENVNYIWELETSAACK